MKLLSKLKEWFCGSKKQVTTNEQPIVETPQPKEITSQVAQPKEITPQVVHKTATTPSISNEEKQVRIALEDIDLQRPEKSEKFLEIIPVIHKYSVALGFISRYNKVAAFYAQTLIRQNGGTLPFEIEKALIENKYCNLLFEFSIQGHTWSNPAKELMKKHHMVVYCHLFGFV